MLVAFRADASVEMGSGHVMRCLTLADALTRKGHSCLFICRNHAGNLSGLITDKGYEVHLLSGAEPTQTHVSSDPALPHSEWLGVSWEHDARQTLEVLGGQGADWLVVDHYALEACWERELAPVVGQIMVIDDLADRNHDCVLLLDQNLGRDTVDYDDKVPSDCMRLIGPHFALLRPEFAEFREHSLHRRRQPELKRILISLGGVDRTNVTGLVLNALAETTLPADTELDIIMGGTAPHLSQVRHQAAQLPFQATVSVNVNNMAERMALADLAIGAAGSTSWERCCLGLPAIMVVLAENQVAAAQAIKELGAAMVSDSGDSVGEILDQLMEPGRLSGYLTRMVESGADMIDGAGCTRVVNELIRRSRTPWES